MDASGGASVLQQRLTAPFQLVLQQSRHLLALGVVTVGCENPNCLIVPCYRAIVVLLPQEVLSLPLHNFRLLAR
jgi:hypothetical protein